MKHILIATHGRLAEGFASSIKILLDREDINCINAYIDEKDKDYTKDIEKFLSMIDMNDEAVIFTDIFGGSVNQKIVKLVHKSEKKVFIVTQVNLPIILEVLLTTESLSYQLIEKMINDSPVKLVKINELSHNNDDSDFFN